VENSGAATSVISGDLVFGINDSGNDPILYAFDSTGTARGSWILQGARNRDWEAIAQGPCTPPTGPLGAASSCLTVADVGDNDTKRNTLTLYRVVEPVARSDARPGSLPTQSLRFRYQGFRADVEAIYVALNGDTVLITKRRMRRADRSTRPALVLRLPASAWGDTNVHEAEVIDSLPIIPGSATGRQVTDASRSHDGHRLAVRTYSEVYLFPIDSLSGRLLPGATWWSCPVNHLDQRNGEGVAWWWDDQSLLLTTEGRRAPFRIIRCDLPVGS